MEGLDSSGRVCRILIWPTGGERLVMEKKGCERRRIVKGNRCIKIS